MDDLALLDYFAARVGTADLDAIRVQADRELLAGRPQPEGEWEYQGIDGVRFNLEVEAGLRYEYAEAMLRARKRMAAKYPALSKFDLDPV